MGAILDNNVIYLSVTDGKISRRVKQPTETSVQRTTKEGKVVNEEIYKGWKGKLTGIHIKEHPQYGRSWLITLSDKDGDAILQMSYSSGYSSAFLKALPNVNLNEDVTLIPSMKIEDDKKKVSLFVIQNEKPLKHFWNKENPGELPPMEKVKVRNKKTGKVEDEWSDFEMMVFLEKYVNENIIPKLSKKSIDVEQKNGKPEPEPIVAEEDEVPDDLPF